MNDTPDALARARRSLDGLSVGDAFGERFFMPAYEVLAHIHERRLPEGAWCYTDDTEMAISIVDMLGRLGRIDQDGLAAAFAERMDPTRGYGEAAYGILSAIKEGRAWRPASRGAFRGQGSFGNGAAMRVAPLGAFFADDIDRCVQEARLSAEVTHAHDEGIAGAIAVAVAASTAWRHRDAPLSQASSCARSGTRVPGGYTREGIEEALGLPAEADIVTAAKALGNGSGVTAPDTVPLCLWIASRHPGAYVEALWETVAALGDRDTTCAIVGGIVGVASEVPRVWLDQREPLPPMEAAAP